MSYRLEDGLNVPSPLHFPVKDPVTGTTVYLVDRFHVDQSLWEHLPRLMPDMNYTEFQETPFEYKGLFEFRDSKWHILPQYFEHWAIGGEPLPEPGMAQGGPTRRAYLESDPMTEDQSAQAAAAVEAAAADEHPRDLDVNAVVTHGQPAEAYSATLPPVASSTDNMIAAMRATANKLITANLSELEEMAVEISGLQVEIRSHRERIFADIEHLGKLTATTIAAKARIVPIVRGIAEEFAAAAQRRQTP